MKRHIFYIFLFLYLFPFSKVSAYSAGTDNPSLDIISMEGEVFVIDEEGNSDILAMEDKLTIGDIIAVSKNSYIDIGYEKYWDNITRIRGNSRVLIRAAHPTSLYMEYGDMFARLNRLPDEAPFEVITPAAVTSVCGSTFRVTHKDDQTTVYNFVSSTVYVYGLNEAGDVISETPIRLEKHEKTHITNFSLPKNPSPMTRGEMLQCQYFAVSIDQNASSVLAGAGIVKAFNRKVSKAMRRSLNKIYGRKSGTPKPARINIKRPKILFARPPCKK